MWYHKQSSILCLIALTILLQSCNKNVDSAKNVIDPFYAQIENSFPVMDIKQGAYIQQATGVFPIFTVVGHSNGFLIVANRNNSIQLFGEEGDTLLSTVGGEGRGPGEFLRISQIQVGYDGALYVLDTKLKRITKFKIANKQLQYKTTLTIKPEANIQVRDIYVTKYGNFGVFHRFDDYKTWDESYHLYRLNDKFVPVKHLIELPGNKYIKVSAHFHIPRTLGRTIYWDLDGEWFYYINSKSSQITKYNINTGQLKTQQYFIFEARTNTKKTKEFFKKRFAPLIKSYPEVADALRKTENLPMFDGFLVSGNRILFNVFHAAGKGGRIICANRTTGQVNYFKTTSYIRNIALGDDILYGVVSTPEKGTQVRILHLN